jgi:hypothetical protein
MPSCGGSGRPRPGSWPSVISQETNFHWLHCKELSGVPHSTFTNSLQAQWNDEGGCCEQVLYLLQVPFEPLAGIPQTFFLKSMLCPCLNLNKVLLLFWECGKHNVHCHSVKNSNFESVYSLKVKLLTLSLTHFLSWVSLSQSLCDLFCYRWNRSLRKCRMK